jgi:hypothetical protein
MYLLFLFLFSACQAGGPVKPAKTLDRASAPSLLEHAAYNSRSQSGYETAFESTLSVPGHDALKYKGKAVWAAPGVLYVQYDGSGGDHKKIVRAGDEAWIYHTLVEDWVTAAEAGMAAAGKGIQNPDEILAVVAEQASLAKAAGPDAVEITLSGAQLAKIMKGQAQNEAFDWEKSSATIAVGVDAEVRVRTLTVKASLASNNADVKGSVAYDARVAVAAYNGAKELAFLDEKQRPLPLSKEVREAVGKIMKEKR